MTATLDFAKTRLRAPSAPPPTGTRFTRASPDSLYEEMHMLRPSRFVMTVALALAGLAGVASAQEARHAAFLPSSARPADLRTPTTTGSTGASAAAEGPSLESSAVAVRHQPSTEAAPAAARHGTGQPEALMIVGGAAILVGLLIGGGPGYAIAVGGAVVGLVGLYQYLQ